MHSTRTRLLPSSALSLLLAAAAAAQTPEFAVTYRGYDTNVYPNGIGAWAARAADFDGDGRVDLAVSSWYANPQLSILLNDGSGGFLAPRTHDLLLGARDLEAADFDNDGDVDIVVSDTGQRWEGLTFELWRNDGSAGFARAGVFPCGQGPTGITAGDFDGDGWLDVAVAHDRYIVSTNTIGVAYNDRSGGFELPRILATAGATHKIDAGDLDGDGLDDLLVAHEASVASVFYASETGFGAPLTLPAVPNGAVPQEACAKLADVDGDGDLDGLFTHIGMGAGFGSIGAVTLFRNEGTGALGPAERIDLLPDGGATGLDVADVDGDGIADIVAAVVYGQWALVRGDGAGGFLPAVAYAGGQEASSVLAFDQDGDGDVDVVPVARVSMEACVFENPGNGVFPRASVLAMVDPSLAPVSYGNLGATDLDLDGDIDFAVGYSANFAGIYGVSVRRNLGDGTFAEAENLPDGIFSDSIALADVDGDGYPDLLASGSNSFGGSPRLRYWLNQRDGTFGARRLGPGYSGQGALDVADVDGDGRNDVLVVSSNGTLYTMRNNGAGFAAPLTHGLTTGTTSKAITSGDFDGDGDIDVATNTAVQGYLEISLGRGNGTYDPPFLAQSGRGVQAIDAADVDGDGVLDLIASYALDGQGASVLLGRGDGSFRPPASYHGSYGTGIADNITVADVDRDGDPDLLVANAGSDDVSFWRNRGGAAFERQIRWGVGYGAPLQDQGASAVVWGEFTGDGIHDLAVLVDPNSNRNAYYYPAIAFLPGVLDTWVGEGGAAAGARGVPLITGTGTLQPGTPASVAIERAAPAAPGVHILGAARLALPLAAGTLIPRPDLLVPFATDATGRATLRWTWPSTPAGGTIHLQSWLLDPAAAGNLAATQGLTARE